MKVTRTPEEDKNRPWYWILFGAAGVVAGAFSFWIILTKNLDTPARDGIFWLIGPIGLAAMIYGLILLIRRR